MSKRSHKMSSANEHVRIESQGGAEDPLADDVGSGESSSTPAQMIDADEVRTLAYQLWQERGCPVDASGQDDWLRAEQKLKEIGQSSEPPSDRPSDRR